MKENEIQKAILEYLNYIGKIYFFRAGSGAIRTENGNYFKSGKVGCPDIVVCYKGKFIGLEVKTEKGKQSDYQKVAEQEIKRAGGKYFMVRSINDVMKIIKP